MVRTDHDGPSGFLRKRHDLHLDTRAEGGELPDQTACRGTEGRGELGGYCTKCRRNSSHLGCSSLDRLLWITRETAGERLS
jgi:hypothetical protein